GWNCASSPRTSNRYTGPRRSNAHRGGLAARGNRSGGNGSSPLVVVLTVGGTGVEGGKTGAAPDGGGEIRAWAVRKMGAVIGAAPTTGGPGCWGPHTPPRGADLSATIRPGLK